MSVTIGKLFESYGYRREEGTCFYLNFVYAHSTLSFNLGMEYIWVVVASIIKCDTQELTMSRPNKNLHINIYIYIYIYIYIHTYIHICIYNI